MKTKELKEEIEKLNNIIKYYQDRLPTYSNEIRKQALKDVEKIIDSDKKDLLDTEKDMKMNYDHETIKAMTDWALIVLSNLKQKIKEMEK